MQVNNTYKNLSPQEQEIFDNYLPDKLKQIEGLLMHFADDAVLLDCTIEKFDKHDAYEIEMVLKMPMKTMKAKETSHTIIKATDLSKDRIVAQIKKFQSTLRNDQLQARRHASIRRPAIHEATVEEASVKEFLKA